MSATQRAIPPSPPTRKKSGLQTCVKEVVEGTDYTYVNDLTGKQAGRIRPRIIKARPKETEERDK